MHFKTEKFHSKEVWVFNLNLSPVPAFFKNGVTETDTFLQTFWIQGNQISSWKNVLLENFSPSLSHITWRISH